MNYCHGLHCKMILQIKWELDSSLPEEHLSQIVTHTFLISMLSRVFEPHISKGIHKFSDLTIHNEIRKIMTLNNAMCIEKKPKPTVWGH